MTDVFDSLCQALCDIIEKPAPGEGVDDAFGQPSQRFKTKITSWNCRVSTVKGGDEYKIGKEFSKNAFKVFMRPPTEDDSGLPFEVTPHHWLKIKTNANGVTLANPFYVNVLGVNNPSFLDHHLELSVEVVTP